MSPLDQAIAKILAGPKGPRIGAFFDFDGTLIDGYSAAAYFGERVRRREAGWREILDMLLLLKKGDLTEAEFGVVIRKGVADWAGNTEDEMRELWARLWRERIADTQFPEAWHLVQAHRRMGHTLAIASSATPYQVMPLADEWGIEHLLCTQPLIHKGRLSGGVRGQPAWGEGKADAVRAFADAQKLRLGQSYAYANGNEDIAFLKTVGHATAINPKPLLADTAQAQQWSRLIFAPRRRATTGSVVRTVGAYGAMAASFVAGLGYARATGDTRRAVDMITSVGSELGFAVAGIKVEVVGEHNLWAQRPAVFIINHQSKLDFFLMMNIVRRGFTGVAKKEAEHTPGFGSFMKMADMAFVDRSDSRRARESLAPVVEKIRKGLCLCIAPEGTRSYSPKLGAFKKGAFHVAIQAGVPIVPVVIRNAGEVMSRNGQTFRPGTVQIAVLPPVDVSAWNPDHMDAQIAAVRQQFVDTLAQWPETVA